MSSGISLRRARPSDRTALVSGNAAMAAETEGLRLDRERLEAGVAALLHDESRGFYVVAEVAGETGGRATAEDHGAIVGQLMVTREWSDWRNAWFWWIQSVHVVPGWRRKGVYRALHEECVRLAREAGACGLRLYVDRANAGAQATYRALGMTQSHYDLFEQEL